MIFSVGFVCAEDVNQTDSDLGVTDEDVISDAGAKTYADLNNDIDTSKLETNLAANYTYNAGTDTIKRINISGDSSFPSYTINGNNHTIDGNNKAGVFKFFNLNVTINDLVIKNCGESSIILVNSILTTNNVIFENNSDPYGGAAVYVYQSTFNANNNQFKDNKATLGSAIYLDDGVLNLNKGVFFNRQTINWSLIYGSSSIINVFNTVFANMTSKYATAAYGLDSRIYVYNSKFVNLSANATGGAIAAKNPSNFIIQNCEFENVKSTKNGGALFIDVNAGSGAYLKGTTIINATKFTNCSSEFGGAILQLGGYLNVIYSEFMGNHADFNGGAIYASNATVYAFRVDFHNNYGKYADEAISRGGALFLDYSTDIEIVLCNFKDNKAFEGGSIYLFDTTFKVLNATSINNGEFIHSYFPGKGSYFQDCDLGNGSKKDTFILEDEYMPYVVNFTGKKFTLNPINVTGSVSDSYFDLRKFNVVTPVKNQGQMGSCWAFGTTGALESAFLKATGIALDISENNIQNSGLRYSYYGRNSLTEGGYIYSGLAYILSWLGVVNTVDDTYDELGKISLVLFTPESYHFTDAVILDPANVTEIKEALIKYGALTAFVNGANPKTSYYNPNTYAEYCNNGSAGNHFITIVGWNDTFSKDNFNITPPADGAWICKNSWGTEWGNGGYFYLSYYDAPLRSNYAIGYVINNTESYNNLYQYDIPGLRGYMSYDGVSSLSYVNTYEALGNDLIAAVGTYFDNANVPYTIKVNVNGNLIYSQKGKSSYGGYQTIKLDKYVSISQKDNFSIEIEVGTNLVPFCGDTRLFFVKGNSVVYTAKGSEDLSSKIGTACIKVYTFSNPNNISGVKKYFNNVTPLEISSGVEGALMIISKEGKSIANATVQGGKAKFDTLLAIGNYTITTVYNDTEYVSAFEVLTTIIILDEETRTLNAQKPVMAYLYGNDEILANANITVYLDNNKYDLKTDANGILSIGTSNLAIGKHELIILNTVTGEESFSIINIVSRFGSVGNIAMDYFDGTAFKVQVYDDYANPAGSGEKVVIIIKKKSYVAYTDANGYVSFVIPKEVTPGSYKLKATYNGDGISKNVKVKQVLKSKKTVKAKKSAKKLVLKATLKTSKKKAIKNKKITFKLNGKKYAAKTNKKGIAKVTVKKSALKKLKAGKKYAVKISYLKDTIKSIVKVKK
ncbi:C1 family peptidase [Methanobrevibacter sp.]|uniref:C1 family peptidase n=1 Tax=Methanobrevibacter sp. TaxID=66852 RepID=UPI00386868E4